MTATATTTTNGRPQRKQLADQLDRLDNVIDGLCVGLPQAVADATREGARQAVRDVILEVMTNADLRAMIAGMAPVLPSAAPPFPPTFEPAAPTEPRVSIWTRLKMKLVAAKTAVAERYRATKAAVTTMTRTLAAVMPLRQILLVAAVVGVFVGLVSYVCPHGLSAIVSAIGGAIAAVAAQIGRWVHRNVLGFVGTS
jgi:hypothetical protein